MVSKGALAASAKTAEKPVRQQLNRILTSKTFLQVDRLKRFLSFIVLEAIAGRGGDLKEYVIGVQVFAKESSFDPRTDPIVRVQARRLRARLVRYYREEGQTDEIIIDLPKGGYAPVFRPREVSSSGHRPSLTTALVGRNIVAVEVFADHTPNGALQSFCHGLRDEIVHALAPIKAIRVLARWGHDSSVDPHATTLRSDAALVITGSVRAAGDQLRITTRLVDGAAGYYLWSESVDTSAANPLIVQERIARTIVEKIEPELPGAAHHLSSRTQNDNLAARNLYLQGRYHLNQRTEEGLQRAVDFFEKALVEDAQFSLAHSGLADAWSLLAHYGVLGPADVWAKAASSAASAVMLDGHSAEAHTSLAHVRATQDWEWVGAEREFHRAIQLNPRYPTTHHWYAMSCLVPMGRLDDGLEQMLLAQSLDPVSSIIARDLAVVYCYRREFEAALDQCDHTIELNPHFAPAYLTLGLVQEQRKDFDEAAAAFRRAADLSPHTPRMQGALARTFALSGKIDQSREMIRTLEQIADARYVSPFEFVTIYFALGDSAPAYRWLNKACDDRCFELLALKVDPRFESLKDDSRFAAAARRVGLG
ncbi:MAG: tetratricopeptide repeat protein [Vicinamibacterales bacterium]